MSRRRPKPDTAACDHISAGAHQTLLSDGFLMIISHVDVSAVSHKHEHLGPRTALSHTSLHSSSSQVSLGLVGL